MTVSERFFPKPPSAWHDESWRQLRGKPQHDRIQEEVLTFLRGRPIAGLPEGAIIHREVEGEYPFVRRGQVIAFADAIDILSVNYRRFVSVFEIKPTIETVFGIVRQAKSILELARSTIEAEQHHVHIVVPFADPLVADLRAEWPHVWAWGATLNSQAESE